MHVCNFFNAVFIAILSFSVFSSFFLFFYHFNKLSGTPYTKWFIRTIPPVVPFIRLPTTLDVRPEWKRTTQGLTKRAPAEVREHVRVILSPLIHNSPSAGTWEEGSEGAGASEQVHSQQLAKPSGSWRTELRTFSALPPPSPSWMWKLCIPNLFKKKKKSTTAKQALLYNSWGPRNEIKTKEGDIFSYLS